MSGSGLAAAAEGSGGACEGMGSAGSGMAVGEFGVGWGDLCSQAGACVFPFGVWLFGFSVRASTGEECHGFVGRKTLLSHGSCWKIGYGDGAGFGGMSCEKEGW
jgi:hypothetical protein